MFRTATVILASTVCAHRSDRKLCVALLDCGGVPPALQARTEIGGLGDQIRRRMRPVRRADACPKSLSFIKVEHIHAVGKADIPTQNQHAAQLPDRPGGSRRNTTERSDMDGCRATRKGIAVAVRGCARHSAWQLSKTPRGPYFAGCQCPGSELQRCIILRLRLGRRRCCWLRWPMDGPSFQATQASTTGVGATARSDPTRHRVMAIQQRGPARLSRTLP